MISVNLVTSVHYLEPFQCAGIGKLRPNVLLMGFKSDWQTASTQAVDDYFAIIQYVSVWKVSVVFLVWKWSTCHVKNSPKHNQLFLHCRHFGPYQRPKRRQCKNNRVVFWWIFNMIRCPTEWVYLLITVNVVSYLIRAMYCCYYAPPRGH